MRTGYETSDIEEFDWHGAPPFHARAVVGFAAVSETETCARTFDLEVTDGALRVDCCEARLCESRAHLQKFMWVIMLWQSTRRCVRCTPPFDRGKMLFVRALTESFLHLNQPTSFLNRTIVVQTDF